MSDDLARVIQTTRWVKAAIRAWSGRDHEDVILDARLTSPPFPGDIELLRQTINDLLSQNLSDYKRITRAKWEANIKQSGDPAKTSTIRDVRNLCHAQR